MRRLHVVDTLPELLFLYLDKKGTLLNSEEPCFQRFKNLELLTLFTTRAALVTIPGPVTYEKIFDHAYLGNNGVVIEVRYRIKP